MPYMPSIVQKTRRTDFGKSTNWTYKTKFAFSNNLDWLLWAIPNKGRSTTENKRKMLWRYIHKFCFTCCSLWYNYILFNRCIDVKYSRTAKENSQRSGIATSISFEWTKRYRKEPWRWYVQKIWAFEQFWMVLQSTWCYMDEQSNRVLSNLLKEH